MIPPNRPQHIHHLLHQIPIYRSSSPPNYTIKREREKSPNSFLSDFFRYAQIDLILSAFRRFGHTISQAPLPRLYARLNAARKKNSTTASNVPNDSVVETYSASSPRSANRDDERRGSVYCVISASKAALVKRNHGEQNSRNRRADDGQHAQPKPHRRQHRRRSARLT